MSWLSNGRMTFATVAFFVVYAGLAGAAVADRPTGTTQDRPEKASIQLVSCPECGVVGSYAIISSSPLIAAAKPVAVVHSAPVACASPIHFYYLPPLIYVPSSPSLLTLYWYHFGQPSYGSYGPGHYRFPYYSYRRPWYTPGLPAFNRNTDLVW